MCTYLVRTSCLVQCVKKVKHLPLTGVRERQFLGYMVRLLGENSSLQTSNQCSYFQTNPDSYPRILEPFCCAGFLLVLYPNLPSRAWPWLVRFYQANYLPLSNPLSGFKKCYIYLPHQLLSPFFIYVFFW